MVYPVKHSPWGAGGRPLEQQFTQSAEQKATQAEISQTSPQIDPDLILMNAHMESLCKAEGDAAKRIMLLTGGPEIAFAAQSPSNAHNMSN